jgi:hypothetical protein
MSNLRIQVRTRIGDSYSRADVLASCKVAGYVFLVHRAGDDATKFATTYAPIGMRASGPYDSIEDAVSTLYNYSDRIPKVIEDAIRTMERDHLPLMCPETGIESEDWQWRETCRFESGEYVPVPRVLDLNYPAEHHLHLSVTKTESDFVAYTPSESYGIQDRQVRIKFGKYLRKTFPQLTDAEIQSAVTALRSKVELDATPAELRFTTERETINRIFETRMCACDSTYESCMFGKFDEDRIRPYHVYADSPDVSVAYVVERGEIVARSVVSTKNKGWVRLYAVDGCSTRCETLRFMLEAAGYSKGDLIGNRLTKLDTSSVMLPYIDNHGMCVSELADYWEVVESGGDYKCDQTDGTASETGPKCDCCHEREEDCGCYTCDCCESRTQHGCDDCSMCDECDGCTQHGGCFCARCSDCSEIIRPRSRHTTRCDCDRCTACGDLTSNCDCEKCETCGNLETDCDCEEETNNAETESETTGDAELSETCQVSD